MRKRHRDFRTAGFSLVEMLIVIAIIGLMMLFAFPRAASIMDHSRVRAARTTIINKYNAARVAARSSNRNAVLKLAGGNVWVELNRLTGTAKDTVGGFGSTSGSSLTGDAVTVTGPDSIRIDPRGILTFITGNVASATYVIVKNAWRDSVTINSYGRVVH
jgi:prepilin-type N-terminal cleavage/methylation domain-containing protein